MIHTIRKLAREIHRRALWQVVGVFVAFSWLTLQGVELATARIGLPEWTPTMALVLIALGLPVVIATAVVQGGIPWLLIRDVVDPNELEGLTPAQVLVVPEAHPLHGVGLLTWRNAILGGVMAAALLVTSVVSYLTMWALGIGPVGSLVAQGVISTDESVLLAPFENTTDHAALGRAAAAAFMIDLTESDVVNVVQKERVGDALERLGHDPTTALTPSMARDVASAEGIRALVEGDIAPFGSGYRISVRIILPPSVAHVSEFHETVADDDDLVPAIDILSERVRAKFGESLRVIRSGSPLVESYGPLLVPVVGS